MRTRSVTLVSALLIVILALAIVPILWELVAGSFTENSLVAGPRVWTLAYYRQLFSDGSNGRAALNTLIFAVGTSVVAIVFGGFQAWIAERTNAPLRHLAYVSTVILIGTPYLVYVIAWTLVLGNGGLVNTILAHISGSSNDAIINVNSLPGMIVIEGLVWSPLAFMIISGAFKQANPTYEEAGRMSGAGTFAIMRRITLPLARPAILAVGLLAFVRACESFEVPAVVGLPGGVTVLTTQVYNAIQRGMTPNYGFANALSVVLMVFVGVLLWRYGALSKKAERFQVVSGEAYRPGVLDLGRARPLFAAVSVVLFVVMIGLPLAVLVLVSLVPTYRGMNGGLFHHLTVQNYASAFKAPALLDGAVNTLVLCLVASLVAMLLTCLIAWFVVRRAAGSVLLDQLVSFPLVIPGIVIGIAIAQVGLASPIPIYGSIWILLFAYIVSFLPFAMRFAYAGVIQIRIDLEEAALVSGAGRLRLFVRVVLPLLGTSLLTGGIFAFMQGARALSMPIFLASPDHPVAAVSLYEAFVNGSMPEVAAFGLVWAVVMVMISILIFQLGKRSKVAIY